MTEREIANLKVLHFPHPVLRRKARPVAQYEPWLQVLGRRMLAIMREHKGVGLAAPQVGISIRLFVGNPTEDPAGDRIYVNPVLSLAEGAETREEGCLSVPDVSVSVQRPALVTLHAYDPTGQPFDLRSDGLMARMWQHECDHLDGRLILDYMDTETEWKYRRVLKDLEAEFKSSQSRHKG